MKNSKGSIFVYVLGGLLLMSLLIFSLTGGSQKSATTGQLDALANGIHSDIGAIVGAINDCALNYSTRFDLDADGDTDETDNPNTVFPLYNTAGTKGGKAGTGINLDFKTNNVVCPGATSIVADMPNIFGPQNTGSLRVLGDTSLYTVNYRTNTTEGVLLRVKRAAADPLWEEAGYRLNSRYSACKAAFVKDGAVDGANCANGCLYFWLVRRTTTAIAVSDDGATCTSP